MPRPIRLRRQRRVGLPHAAPENTGRVAAQRNHECYGRRRSTGSSGSKSARCDTHSGADLLTREAGCAASVCVGSQGCARRCYVPTHVPFLKPARLYAARPGESRGTEKSNPQCPGKEIGGKMMSRGGICVEIVLPAIILPGIFPFRWPPGVCRWLFANCPVRWSEQV